MASILNRYQRIAAFYDFLDYPFEQMRYRYIRPLSLQDCRAASSMPGWGPGATSPSIHQKLMWSGSPAMLARARRRAQRAARPVDLRLMDVTHLDLPDHSFDAAVASFLFCVLPGDMQVPALREMARVLKPGGTLRMLEYVRPQSPRRAFVACLFVPDLIKLMSVRTRSTR